MIRDILIGLLSVTIFISIILFFNNHVYALIIIPFIFLFLYFVIKKKDLLEKVGNIISTNIKSFLIGLFSMAFLFIFFLYSGGVYHYYERTLGYPMIRVNKITGEFQMLDWDIWKKVEKK